MHNRALRRLPFMAISAKVIIEGGIGGIPYDIEGNQRRPRGPWYYDMRYGEPPIESGQAYG